MKKKATKKTIRKKKSTKSIDDVLDKGVNVDFDEGDFDRGVLSTGSTLLDLAISGNRIEGGGIPSGVIVEIYGPPSSGKTAILAELGASCKYKGGSVMYDDPEGRLDKGYARRCGLVLKDSEYNRPDTVDQLEEDILNWNPESKRKNAICIRCEDSLSAFSTLAELDDNHKMAAAKRAAMFHQLFRKLGRKINKEGWIIACSNQEQTNFETGAKTTPTGAAIKYWSSVRIRVAKAYKAGEIKKVKKISSKYDESRIMGIKSIAKVIKNSCDDPQREAPLYIMFGRGIDDIRGNLQWLKEVNSSDSFDCFEKKFKFIDPAIRYIEDHNLEMDLRKRVIDKWKVIQSNFRIDRKRKVRF